MLASGWEVSTDARTWTFELREGVPWHWDHGEFMSKDVIHSLHRAVNAEVSEFPHKDRFPQQDGSPGRIVERVETIGDYKIRFDLAVPYVRLFKALSGSEGLFITSKEYFESAGGAANYANNPIGTGPYEFLYSKYPEFTLWEFVRYDHYRVNPHFGELRLHFIKDEATRFAMLATLEADITVVGRGLTSQASQLGLLVIQTTLPTHQLNLSFGGNYIPGTLTFEGSSAVDESLPWYGSSEDAIKVRRALSKAIDRVALNESLYDGKGHTAHVSLFHPQLGSWRDDWEGWYQRLHGYNPEEASRLLGEAGFPDGIDGYKWVVVYVNGSTESGIVAQIILDQWEEIGVDIGIQRIQRDDWMAKLRDKETAGLVYAWRSPWQPAETSLEQYVYSEGSAVCCSTIELDRLIEDLSSEPDPMSYDEKLMEIGEVILNTAAIIPLFWEYTDVIVNPNVVAEYKTNGILHIHDWEYAKSEWGPSDRWWERLGD